MAKETTPVADEKIVLAVAKATQDFAIPPAQTQKKKVAQAAFEARKAKNDALLAMAHQGAPPKE